MREDIDFCNFTAGQLGQKLKGRSDYERYYNGAATVLNMVPMPQGGATRRPGTQYVTSSAWPVSIPPQLANPTIQVFGSVSPNSDWAIADWANRRFYCPTAFNAGVVEYNMDTGAVIATKTAAAIGVGGVGNESALDSSGNIYFQQGVGNVDEIYKIAPGLALTASFGTPGGFYSDPTTQWPNPTASGNLNCVKCDATYLVTSASIPGVAYVLNADTMAFAGYSAALLTQGNGVGCAGPQSAASATLYFLDYPHNVSTCTQTNFYSMTIKSGAAAYVPSSWPTANPFIATASLATIHAGDVDAAWTHIAVGAIMYDATDGNVIFTASTADTVTHQKYVVKINAATGAVMWKIAIAPTNIESMGGSAAANVSITYGTLGLKADSGSVYCIDTRAGTILSTVAITGLGLAGDIASSDTTGDILVYGNYAQASSNVVPVGGTPATYSNLWGRLDLAAGGGVGVYRPALPLMASRLEKFVFSTTQAYMLEFSQYEIAVYANDTVALKGGVPITVATPWTFADLPLLQFTQSADTLYIYHPNYAPRKLTRDASNVWTLSVIAWRDGPYLDVNGTTTTLTPSGVTGTITITASSTVGINATSASAGLGFQASDLNRLLRIRLFSLWAWCKITGVNSTTEVTAVVQGWVTNGGAYGAIDGKAWAANTLYPTGAVVLANGNYYIAITGGVSGPSNGPAGTGSNLLDGTVTWSLAGPFDAIAWRQYTVYAPGDIVYSTPPSGSGLFYQCTTGGNTGGSSVPPVGTGTGITAADQNCIWESIAAFTFPTSTTFWALGKWYGADGSPNANYPQIPLFWQQRLMSLSTPNEPGAVEGSYSSDFTNMAPTAADGSVTAANAVSWVIASDEVNDVRWAIGAGSSVAQQLGIGTSGGEWVMQPATNSEALSPTNVQVYQETKFGGAKDVQALRIGKSILFADRSGRKLYDWIWQWALNGFIGIDRTVDADDITICDPPTLQGIIQMAWQQAPHGVIWIARGDGKLIGLTYLPDEKIIAWHQHQLGGVYNGGPPLVESVACIPSPDATYDELWLVVRRSKPDGTTMRTVEVMTRYFDSLSQDQSWFVDCALASALSARTDTLTFTALSGTGVNFNAAGGGFSSATVGAIIRVNNGIAIVRSYVDATDVKADWMVAASATAPAGTTAWSLTAPHTAFTGLTHLEGQNVQVLGDGADCGTVTVAGDGSFAIAAPGASYAIAGLAAPFKLVTMPWIPQRAAPVPATGKTKIIGHLYIRFYQSLGCLFGQHRTDPLTGAIDDRTETLEIRSAGDALGWAPAYVSQIRRVPMAGGFDEEGQIVVTGQGPFPCTVLSIGASADVGSS